MYLWYSTSTYLHRKRMMQEQQGCCVVETTSVVCSGPGDWAWRSRGLETWRSRGLGAWRSRGLRAWRSRGLDLGLGAWGLLPGVYWQWQ